MKYDIISFGSAVVDVFVHTNVSESNNFMHYPIGAKILIKELKFDIGGGGTNTAVAFARLGLKTGCICGIGNDENGKRVTELLKKEKIDFLGKINKKEMTGYSIILDSKGGDRTILTYKGANNKIRFKNLNIKNIDTSWIYLTALLKESFQTQVKLAKILYKKGVKIAYNPSLYIINNEPIDELLKFCEVMILNKEEAQSLIKRFNKNKDLFIGLHKLGPKITVVTDKDNPAVCYDGKEKYSITPHKNVKVVERTGAGDAFASGFIAGLVVEYSIPKCLELALKESESVIQKRGAKLNLLKINMKKR
ncbi:MAG: adenosine kinase [Nanoarchaeota archaeon]|nr:adenosine kinase [Nanoarchaeota archaeon]